MTTLFWNLLAAIWVSALGMSFLGTWAAWRHLKGLRREDREPNHRSSMSPISILKPLRGLDEGLAENLSSFFRLEYPEYEIIFSVADAEDPACALCLGLIAQYPKVSARLIVGAMEVGPNPKVNNLIKSYAQAKHDWILISDSNIRVTPDYLERVAAPFEEDVGIVTAMVSGRTASRLGGMLEATFLNTFYAKALSLAAMVGHPLVLGKSMLFRRSVMNRIGGIGGLRAYMAEDYVAGQKLIAMGMRIAVVRTPVQQHIGEYSFKTFWLRHLRWGRIRKMQTPWIFLLELCFVSVVSGLCGALAFHHYYGISVLIFLAVHLLIWLAEDLLVMSLMGQRPTLRSAGVWFIRELSYLPLWAHIACGNTVMWRGQKLKLCLGGGIAERDQVAFEGSGPALPATPGE